jgi:hypothetical protein
MLFSDCLNEPGFGHQLGHVTLQGLVLNIVLQSLPPLTAEVCTVLLTRLATTVGLSKSRPASPAPARRRDEKRARSPLPMTRRSILPRESARPRAAIPRSSPAPPRSTRLTISHHGRAALLGVAINGTSTRKTNAHNRPRQWRHSRRQRTFRETKPESNCRKRAIDF